MERWAEGPLTTEEMIEIQLSLAAKAVIPRIEYFTTMIPPLTLPSPSAARLAADKAVSCSTADDDFVHRSFLLPSFEALLHCSTEADPAVSAEVVDGAPTSTPPMATPLLAFQEQLRHDVRRQQQYFLHQVPPPPLELVGGLDISFIPKTNDGVVCLSIFRFPTMELVHLYLHLCPLTTPYQSAFLAFREVEPVLRLFERVRPMLLSSCTMPQLLLVDGGGVHHPRRCGLATCLGVTLQLPTIGCAKKFLEVGGITRGDVEATSAAFLAYCQQSNSDSPTTASTSSSSRLLRPLLPVAAASLEERPATSAELYGYAISTSQSAKKNIYVSPGHQVGYAVAAALTMLMRDYRVPTPIRAADLASREFIREGCRKTGNARTTVV